jgi:peptide deformylase
MSVINPVQLGHPALKAENKVITDFSDPKLTQLITDLRDTMYHVGLIGIAAPQIGENYQVFITEPRETDVRPKDQADEFRVYINPKIIWHSSETVVIWEGCGSMFSDVFGPVTRPKTVEVEAFDQTGKRFRFKADGILGRVIQHEFDHLQGTEFIVKVDDYARLKSKDFYIKDEKFTPAHLAAQKITLKEFHQL